jgi:hypothetical protein
MLYSKSIPIDFTHNLSNLFVDSNLVGILKFRFQILYKNI